MVLITSQIQHNPQPEDVGTIKVSVNITKNYQRRDLLDEEIYEEIVIYTSRHSISSQEVTQTLMRSGMTSSDACDVLLELFQRVDDITSSNDYSPHYALKVWTNFTVFLPPEEELTAFIFDTLEEEIQEEEQVARRLSLEDTNAIRSRQELTAFGFDTLEEIQEEEQVVQRLSLGATNSIWSTPAMIYLDEELSFFGFDTLEEEEEEEVVRLSFDYTNTIRSRPASKLVVGSLRRKIYNKSSDIVGEIDTCTICLEELNDGARVVTLPCGHDFDVECIVKWFESSHVCPLCRFELPRED